MRRAGHSRLCEKGSCVCSCEQLVVATDSAEGAVPHCPRAGGHQEGIGPPGTQSQVVPAHTTTPGPVRWFGEPGGGGIEGRVQTPLLKRGMETVD